MKNKILILPILTFTIIFFWGYVSYIHSQKTSYKETKQLFNLYSEKYFNAFQEKINSYLAVGQAVKSLFNSSQFVSREEFKVFSQGVLTNHQEIQAINWIVEVNEQQRANYERTVRDEGFINFNIHQGFIDNKRIPSLHKPSYFPIQYTEPFNANKKAHGFDIANNPVSLQAIEQANSSQEYSVSGALTIVQEIGNQKSIVFFYPIYKNQSLMGFVQVVLRMSNVLNATKQYFGLGKDLLVRVYDVSEGSHQLITSDAIPRSTTDKKSFFKEMFWNIDGRQWKVEFYPSSVFMKYYADKQVLASTHFFWETVIAFILSFLIYIISKQSKQVKQDASLLELAQRKLLFQKNAIDKHAIVSVTDVKGNITYVNEKFLEISQYSYDELIGQNHRILQSGFHPESFFKDMWYTISNGNAWQGQIRNKAKGGSIYWVESTIAPMLNKQGQPEQYISIRTDITAIKRLELQQKRTTQNARIRAKVSQQLQQQAPLKKRLEEVLESLCQFEELKIQQKAGIFLTENNALHLFATHGQFSDEFILQEQCVQAGECLCGRVLENGLLKISDDCFTDHEHEHKFEDMTAHGHYIVPLNYTGKVLGVLFLYTKPYPTRSPELLAILNTIGLMVGLAIANEKSQEALIKEKSKADQANKAKSEFLSSMSHELRTPLISILGFSQLLESDKETPLSEDQRENVDCIISSGRHLLSLINEILELSAIEAGKVTFSIEPIDIREVVSKSLTLLTPLASKANIEMHCLSDIEVIVSTDYTKLQQVILNLVSNAIKYNRQAGSVCIDWRQKGKVIRVNVIDTGIGISEANKHKVFESFNRLGLENSGVEGTGVGLVVIKGIVEMMGGEIGFESIEGEGSTFWFELPISEVMSEDKESSEATVIEI